MRRTRFPIVAMLAAALLTAGCGGDDTTDESEDDAQAEAASEVAATGDEPTATASETTEPAEPSDATPQPEPEPELQLVPLGTRFEWCAEVQGDLEELVQARAAADEAEAALQEAQAALDAATDELDRAEARQVRDSLTERRDALRDEVKTSRAFRWLWGHGLLGADEARHIAFERAVDAFLADADPAVVDLLWARSDYEWAESQYNRGIWQTPRESLTLHFNAEDVTVVESGVPPVLSVEEAVAAIDDWRIRALAVAEDAAASQSENWRAFQLAATTGEVL